MFGSDTQRTYVKLNSKKQLKQFPVHNCLHYFCIGSDHEKTIMFQGLRAQKGHLSSWRRNFWARQHLHKGIPVSASLCRNQYIHILVCVGDFYGLWHRLWNNYCVSGFEIRERAQLIWESGEAFAHGPMNWFAFINVWALTNIVRIFWPLKYPQNREIPPVSV